MREPTAEHSVQTAAPLSELQYASELVLPARGEGVCGGYLRGAEVLTCRRR